MVHSIPSLDTAHRLVLSGRLAEATALIQSRLGGGGRAEAPAAVFRGPTLELKAEAARSGETARPRSQPRSRPRFPFAQGHGLPGTTLRPAPAVPSGAQFLRLEHRGPAGRRAYRLYVPANAGEAPLPLVVMLHGCTQNPEDFALGTRMNALAEERQVLVAYPEQDRAANPSLCWNWFEPAHQTGQAGEPAILAGIVEDIARDHGVDRDRIFVASLSAGGAMAAVLGATRPDLFAAVGVHSGLPHAGARDVASALSLMRSGRSMSPGRHPDVPAIVFHGARDTTVHPANGDRVAGLDAARRGASSEGLSNGRAFTRTVLPAETERPAAEHWRVEGLAHAWSGGDAAGSYADPAGPDASREMLRFFLEHPRGR